MKTLYDRRVSSIVGKLESAQNITSWLKDLGSNGKWPDSQIDYTTGCDARRANWPAQWHWQRILVMAGAWRGGFLNAPQWTNNAQLRNATGRAMAYWFGRDMNTIACLDNGGTVSCPCENPQDTLWNTNWYSNIILIPGLVAQSCMLLNATLTPSEATYCGRITTRSYGTFDRNLNGVGYLTGANTLDVAKISVDAALLTNNASMLADAYRRVHDELTIKNDVKADGIRADGSFGQHKGVLYNGNYGKDYSNVALELEVASAGTQYAAGPDSRSAFEVLIQGHQWMIYVNSLTQVLHFDFSAIGRMITFPVFDDQASASIQMNLTTALELGNLWSSLPLITFASQLLPGSITANAGGLIGNKMFYANDYMVHRGANYVLTLKMYSKRTQNSECVNSQNPKGFHLSDGAMYTYVEGDEYEDIFAAWDWDLIPGTTVDYKRTPLACDRTGFTGIETFVGGASDGLAGIAAMRYTNPSTKVLQWQKAWFFLEDGVHHIIANVLSSDGTAPVYSVLDQKRHSGPTIVAGTEVPLKANETLSTFSKPSTIWHDNVGYSFPANTSALLNVRRGERVGDWSTIGTSTQPPVTVDLWAAWLQHAPASVNSPVEYSMYPGVSYQDFVLKRSTSPVATIESSANVSAIYNRAGNRVMLVLWKAGSKMSAFQSAPAMARLTISSNNPVALMLSLDDGRVTASDPSQGLNSATVKFEYGTDGQLPTFWVGGRSKTLNLTFPRGGTAGSSVLTRL